MVPYCISDLIVLELLLHLIYTARAFSCNINAMCCKSTPCWKNIILLFLDYRSEEFCIADSKHNTSLQLVWISLINIHSVCTHISQSYQHTAVHPPINSTSVCTTSVGVVYLPLLFFDLLSLSKRPALHNKKSHYLPVCCRHFGIFG